MATIRKFTFDTRFDDADAARPTLGQALAGSQAAKGVPFEAGMPGKDKARPQPAQSAPEPVPEPEPAPEPEAPPEAEAAPQPDADAQAAPEAADAGPALAYTEEDMEIAREEAYIAGHTLALDEASAAAEKATADALGRVATALGTLSEGVAEAHADYADMAARVATEVCRRLLPETSEDYAAGEIAGLMRNLLPNLIGQPRLLIRTHPDIRDAVHQSLSKVMEQAGFEGRLSVLADAALTASDCRIEWSEGGADRNTTKLWADIDDLMERNIPLFRRSDALEMPEEETPEPEPPADVWPQDIDTAAWWTPPEPAPEDLAMTEPEPEPEPASQTAPEAEPEDPPMSEASDTDPVADAADPTDDNGQNDDAAAPDDIAADAPEDADASDAVRQTQQPVDVDG